MDFTNIVPPSEKAQVRKNNHKGVLTIVQKAGSSNCITFSLQLADVLGLTDKVIVGFLKEEKKILLGKKLPGINHDGYELKCRMSHGKCIKKVIYSAPLVREIIEMFQMDFSGKTTETLYDLNIEEEQGCKIAIIGK